MKRLINKTSELIAGLRAKGYCDHAEKLEDRLFTYKTAQEHLYRVFNEDGEDVINFAHPSGDAGVCEAEDGFGDIETVLSTHEQMMNVVRKQPEVQEISPEIALEQAGDISLDNVGILNERVARRCDELLKMAAIVLMKKGQDSAPSNTSDGLTTEDIKDLEGTGGQLDIAGDTYEKYKLIIDNINSKLEARAANIDGLKNTVDGNRFIYSKIRENVTLQTISREEVEYLNSVVNYLDYDKISEAQKQIDTISGLLGKKEPGGGENLDWSFDTVKNLATTKNIIDQQNKLISGAIQQYNKSRDEIEKNVGIYLNSWIVASSSGVRACKIYPQQLIKSNFEIIKKLKDVNPNIVDKINFNFDSYSTSFNVEIGKSLQASIIASIKMFITGAISDISSISIARKSSDEEQGTGQETSGDAWISADNSAKIGNEYIDYAKKYYQYAKRTGTRDKLRKDIKMLGDIGKVLQGAGGKHPEEMFELLKPIISEYKLPIQSSADLYMIDSWINPASPGSFAEQINKVTASIRNKNMIKIGLTVPVKPKSPAPKPGQTGGSGAGAAPGAGTSPGAGTGQYPMAAKGSAAVGAMQLAMTSLAEWINNNNAGDLKTAKEEDKPMAQFRFGMTKAELTKAQYTLTTVNSEMLRFQGSVGDGIWGSRTDNALKTVLELIKKYNAQPVNKNVKSPENIFIGKPGDDDKAENNKDIITQLIKRLNLAIEKIQPKPKVIKQYNGVPLLDEFKREHAKFQIPETAVDSLASFTQFIESQPQIMSLMLQQGQQVETITTPTGTTRTKK